jgi:hypothetical protein
MPSELSLSDAISHFHAVSATTHQFWAYFQFVAAGAVTVAWAVPLRGSKAFCWLLTIGLTVFSAINGFLVYRSQEDMAAVAKAIQDCVAVKTCVVGVELLPITNSIGAAEPWLVALAYLGLWGAAVVAVWLPNWKPALARP